MTTLGSNFKPASHLPRSRSNTDHSEDTVFLSQKEELLKYPAIDELDARTDTAAPQNHTEADRVKDQVKKEKDTEIGEAIMKDMNGDYQEMFGGDEVCQSEMKLDQPLMKKQKLNALQNGKGVQMELQQIKKVEDRKKTLSKWASRLFDPNRPRGLIEAPAIIPLNDEFLSEFGKRERDFAEATGEVVDIDKQNLDEELDETSGTASKEMKVEEISNGGFKVKISNLAYTTTKITLSRKCEKYGNIIDVKLIMDPKSEKLSLGRAYVTFELAEDRKSCILDMNDKVLDGRQVRIMKVESKNKKRESLSRQGIKGGTTSRYWLRDITTKCFRCGKVGHMADSCPNAEVPKPCNFCGKIDHESRACKLTKLCFKCTVPGHINRECPHRQFWRKRVVCGICFSDGHDSMQCRERLSNIPSYHAICFICGETGHFSCKSMRWSLDLRGVSCFNCGEAGHLAIDCRRPILNECARNTELTLQEINRAETLSLTEKLDVLNNRKNKNNAEPRGLQDRNGNQHRERAHSQPPDSFFRSQPQTPRYGKIETGHSRGRSTERRYREDTNESRSRGYSHKSRSRGYSDESRSSGYNKESRSSGYNNSNSNSKESRSRGYSNERRSRGYSDERRSRGYEDEASHYRESSRGYRGGGSRR